MRTCNFLLIILLSTTGLHSQQTPSLGEIARRVRAEKNDKTEHQQAAAAAPGAQQAATPAQPAKPAEPAPPPGVPVATNEDAAARQLAQNQAHADEMNLHEISRFEDLIRTLFNTDNFQKIDEIADQARSTKQRLKGGFWAIHLLYHPLMKPPHGSDDSTESEWQIHLARLQRWVDQRPQSITARVALAGAYNLYAWKARGGGYAGEVTDEGWRLFGERTDRAAAILVEAFKLPVKDPEWYLDMQAVMQGKGESKSLQTAMFEKAIAFEPDYQYYYRMQAVVLLPQWEGEEGESALFAQNVADRIGGKKGDMMYYEISTVLNCSCDSRNQPNGMSWPRIKRGYADVEEQHGVSLVNMNQMAAFAAAAGDPDFAQQLLNRIGENWDPDAWQTRQHFEEVRSWAQFSEIEQTGAQGKQAAEANLQTPAGRQFDAEMARSFQANYRDILAACVTLAGPKQQVPFDLILRIGKTGTVEKVYFSVTSQISLCLASKVSQGHFPAPPQPEYWVKVKVNFQP